MSVVQDSRFAKHSALAQGGFTLVEFLLTAMLVSILAAIALPRLLDAGTDARIQAVEFAESQLDAAVKQVRIAAMMPGAQLSNPSLNSDQTVLDLNKNGSIDADDILLINQNVDNSDVYKIIDVGGSMVLQEGPTNNQVHIGYDLLGNGNIRGGNCRVYFRQANSSERYAFVSSRTDGC